MAGGRQYLVRGYLVAKAPAQATAHQKSEFLPIRDYIRRRDLWKRMAADWPEGSEKREAALETVRAIQRTIDDIKMLKT